MAIIRQQDYVSQPWKNGLGATKQIFDHHAEKGLVWRLSLAAVTSDGPFSRFSGLERVLTVVKGRGMRLQGVEFELSPNPLCPVSFPGNTLINGYCIDGPVKNFNLIFNPMRVSAQVWVGQKLECPNRDAGPHVLIAVYILGGHLALGDVQRAEKGDTCILSPSEMPAATGEGLHYVGAQMTPVMLDLG